MVKIVTAREMQSIDEKAINNFNIPGIVLMENAGLGVVKKIKEIFSSQIEGKRVMIFCGKGNNGGDGMVVARHLMNNGLDVKLFLTCSPSEIKGDAATNLKTLQSMGAKIYPVINKKDLHRADISMLYTDLVIDAIYGTGFKGKAQGVTAELIKIINQNNRPIISVDLPSGLEADTGKVYGECIKADYTITFGLPKIGLFLEPGCRFSGNIEVVDISIPAKLLKDNFLKRELITEQWAKQNIKKRDREAHKGTFGHVLILGGSPGMTGAVCLTALGALRTGAGIVTVAVPRSLNAIVEQKLTETITKPLPESDNGFLGRDSLESILESVQKADVIAIGPGMGVSVESETLLKELLPQLKIPVVLDADGLNLLSNIIKNDKDFIKKLPKDIILTPHPGEMSRLADMSISDIQENRLKVAEKFSKDWNCNLVLKGAKTIISSPSNRTYLNITGNPGMATGGSGDVLTGIISSFVGQGYNCLTSSAMGVFIHGFAADIAAGVKGEYSLTAGDIVEYLPRVLMD